MTDPTTHDSPWRRPVLAAILLVAVAVGSRGITDEASVMLGADMARYLMNGVFIHDLVADGGAWSLNDLASYAEHYYARYPALSLGHHPPLPSVALVPFYAVFGVSVFAARMAALCWFLLAVWGVYALGRRLSGWQVASWAAVLFATNLFVVRFGQYVMSEMPMLALVLLSLNTLFVACETRQWKHVTWFMLAVVASLYAKQLAVFMFPVYAVIVVSRLGWRGLINRRLLLVAGIGGVLLVPLVLMTIKLSASNVGFATKAVAGLVSGQRKIGVGTVLKTIVTTHLSLPAMLVAALGAVLLAARRERHALIVLTWFLAVGGGCLLFAGVVEPPRYSFSALPAYALLAAGLAGGFRSKGARVAGAVALSGVVLWQVWLGRDVRPIGAGGYETAAEYVIANSREPAVLFDTPVDTGYFVFFVRKHDPDRRLVLLRADKLMPPPIRGPQTYTPEQLYALLQKFGVRYVVIEEITELPRVVPLLHAEVKTDRFIERQRIPIASRQPEVEGVDLVIYEYKDAQPGDPDAEFDLGIPLGNRAIKIRMRDLVRPKSP
jgi:hypothetical protein